MLNNNSNSGLWERILKAFKARSKVYGPYEGGEYLTKCIHPERHKHNDRNPSMTFNPRRGAYCKVCGEGWGLEELAKELGVEVRDDNRTNRRGITLEEFASAKGLDPELLQSLGWQEIKRKGKKRLLIPYCSEDGELQSIRYRASVDGDLKFFWERGARAIPYGLPRLSKARELGYIVLVEGETDAVTLWQGGLPVLGIPGANLWRKEWGDYLQDIEKVFIWREPDKAGEKFVERIAESLGRDCYIVSSEEAKDANELCLLYGNDFPRKLGELLSQARKYQLLEPELPQELVSEPHVLQRFIEDIAKSGVVGEERLTGILALALQSSMTDRPINTGIVSPPSSGKSEVLNAVLECFPEESYILRSGGSERSFIFSDEDLQNRFLVFEELGGYSRGETGRALLHSLTWSNKVSYEVTVKGRNGQFKTDKLSKPGPTGFLFTNTSLRGLDKELKNRLLLVSSQPSDVNRDLEMEQTRNVMRSIADRLNGSKPSSSFSTEDWKLLFRSLRKPAKVEIPWGRWLADRVDASTLSIRRKFKLFLYFAYSSALLHRFHRRRNGEGKIVADVRDYANAYALIGKEFKEAQKEGISARAREIAEYVDREYDPEGEEITVRKIAETIGISSRAVRKHLSFLDSEGYVRRLEGGKGKAIKVRPGEALPEEPPPLPKPEAMAEDFPELDGEWVDPISGKNKEFFSKLPDSEFQVPGRHGLNSENLEPSQVPNSSKSQSIENKENLEPGTWNNLESPPVPGSDTQNEGEKGNLEPGTKNSRPYVQNKIERDKSEEIHPTQDAVEDKFVAGFEMRWSEILGMPPSKALRIWYKEGKPVIRGSNGVKVPNLESLLRAKMPLQPLVEAAREWLRKRAAT